MYKFCLCGGLFMFELKGCTCKSCTSIFVDGSESFKCICVEVVEKVSWGYIGVKFMI